MGATATTRARSGPPPAGASEARRQARRVFGGGAAAATTRARSGLTPAGAGEARRGARTGQPDGAGEARHQARTARSTGGEAAATTPAPAIRPEKAEAPSRRAVPPPASPAERLRRLLSLRLRRWQRSHSSGGAVSFGGAVSTDVGRSPAFVPLPVTHPSSGQAEPETHRGCGADEGWRSRAKRTQRSCVAGGVDATGGGRHTDWSGAKGRCRVGSE